MIQNLPAQSDLPRQSGIGKRIRNNAGAAMRYCRSQSVPCIGVHRPDFDVGHAAIAGYYLDLGGFGFNSGCLWVSVDNSVSAETFITGGTVAVAESGDVCTVTVNAT